MNESLKAGTSNCVGQHKVKHALRKKTSRNRKIVNIVWIIGVDVKTNVQRNVSNCYIINICANDHLRNYQTIDFSMTNKTDAYKLSKLELTANIDNTSI